MRPLFLPVCGALLGAPLIGLSQDKKMSLQFIGFPQQLKPEPVELVVGKEKTIEVATPGHELSPAYRVPAMGAIVVGKTVMDEEGKPTFKELGRAAALNAAKQIVLLLRKAETADDGFVVLPVNGEVKDFRGGSYFFINASSYSMGVEIGNQEFSLKPGQRKKVKPEPDHEGNVCQTTFSYLKEDKWKRFHDTRWPINERYRTLVFFYQDSNTNRIGVAPIMDLFVE